MDEQTQSDFRFFNELNYDLPEDLTELTNLFYQIHLKYNSINPSQTIVKRLNEINTSNLQLKDEYDSIVYNFEKKLFDFNYFVDRELKEWLRERYPSVYSQVLSSVDIEYRFNEFLDHYNDKAVIDNIKNDILTLKHLYGYLENPIDQTTNNLLETLGILDNLG